MRFEEGRSGIIIDVNIGSRDFNRSLCSKFNTENVKVPLFG